MDRIKTMRTCAQRVEKALWGRLVARAVGIMATQEKNGDADSQQQLF